MGEVTKTRRRYSDNDRATALAAYDACGSNLHEASRVTGVPIKTIAEWRDGRVSADCAELRTEKKAELAEVLDDIARQILAAVPGKIDDASLKDSLVSVGVAIDKAQLLKGQPTNITQTNADPDAARRELRDFVSSRLAGVDRERDGRGDRGAVSARQGDDRGGVPAVH